MTELETGIMPPQFASFAWRLMIAGLSIAAVAGFTSPALAQNVGACRAGTNFERWLTQFKQDAVKAGASRAVVSRALDGAQPDEKVLRLSESQPEFKTPIWDYFGFLIDEQRVADGRAMMRKYDRVLRAAEQRYGVDRHVIAAVWGVETNYGREGGDSFLPHALATLVCQSGRRKDFWRGEKRFHRPS